MTTCISFSAIISCAKVLERVESGISDYEQGVFWGLKYVCWCDGVGAAGTLIWCNPTPHHAKRMGTFAPIYGDQHNTIPCIPDCDLQWPLPYLHGSRALRRLCIGSLLVINKSNAASTRDPPRLIVSRRSTASSHFQYLQI